MYVTNVSKTDFAVLVIISVLRACSFGLISSSIDSGSGIDNMEES